MDETKGEKRLGLPLEEKIRFLAFRFMETYRTLGIWKTLWIGPQWLVRREFVLLSRDLRRPLPENLFPDSMRWSALTEKEIPLLGSIHPRMSGEEIRRRWEEGLDCLLFWMRDSIVHYRWYAPVTSRAIPLPFLGKRLQIQEGDHFIIEVFTPPIFRKQGIMSAVSTWCLHRSKKLGFERSLALVADWNAPSMRVAREKAGRVVLGTLGYWSLGLGRYYFATGNAFLDKDMDRYRIDPKNRATH